MTRSRLWAPLVASLLVALAATCPAPTGRGTAPLTVVAAGGTVFATGEASLVTSGCTVRFGDAGPVVYTNAMHYVVGCEAVSVDSQGRLVITKTDDLRPIVTMYASPDETLVARGISVGLSGGARTTIGVVYDSRAGRVLNLNAAADYARISGEYANLWVGWVNADPSPAS